MKAEDRQIEKPGLRFSWGWKGSRSYRGFFGDRETGLAFAESSKRRHDGGGSRIRQEIRSMGRHGFDLRWCRRMIEHSRDSTSRSCRKGAITR